MSERLDLQIVRGNPTAEELAALVVALALHLRPATDPAQPESAWARNTRSFRQQPVRRFADWRGSRRVEEVFLEPHHD